MSISLVFEVTYSSEHHCQSMLVGSGYYFIVPHRSTWLDHCSDSMFCCFINSITKWKKGVGGEHRSGDWELSAHRTNLNGINTRHLSCTDANSLVFSCVDDCI